MPATPVLDLNATLIQLKTAGVIITPDEEEALRTTVNRINTGLTMYAAGKEGPVPSRILSRTKYRIVVALGAVMVEKLPANLDLAVTRTLTAAGLHFVHAQATFGDKAGKISALMILPGGPDLA